jgi:bleomycin hydrolase
MKETYQSSDSGDMNKIIKEQLDSAVNEMRRNPSSAETVRKVTLSNVYNTLVKFLGKPPQSFSWFFNRNDIEDSCSTIVEELDPFKFLKMVTANTVNVREDFVVLAHIPTPGLQFYQSYRVKCTNNVHEGDLCTVFNVPIQELCKYAMKSIQAGMAVWFAGDVMQSFNWFHSALDDKLDAQHTLFKQPYEFNKSDRIVMRSIQTNHAMALTGFNIDKNNNTRNWQVENSWGYWDNETPGMDGFLTMSQSWFEKYVTEVVVCKRFLTKKFLERVEKSVPIEIEPWDAMAPALRTGGFGGVPVGYPFRAR